MNIRLQYAGFSLIECLTTLALLSLLAIAAITYGGSWFTEQKSKSFLDQLVRELHFARQQAILRQTTVTICPSFDFTQCAAAEAWSHGYLIFLDPTGQADFNATTPLLAHTATLQTGTLTNSRDYLQFTAQGFTASTNSTFFYQASDKAYRIIVNLLGRIRVEK